MGFRGRLEGGDCVKKQMKRILAILTMLLVVIAGTCFIPKVEASETDEEGYFLTKENNNKVNVGDKVTINVNISATSTDGFQGLIVYENDLELESMVFEDVLKDNYIMSYRPALQKEMEIQYKDKKGICFTATRNSGGDDISGNVKIATLVFDTKECKGDTEYEFVWDTGNTEGFGPKTYIKANSKRKAITTEGTSIETNHVGDNNGNGDNNGGDNNGGDNNGGDNNGGDNNGGDNNGGDNNGGNNNGGNNNGGNNNGGNNNGGNNNGGNNNGGNNNSDDEDDNNGGNNNGGSNNNGSGSNNGGSNNSGSGSNNGGSNNSGSGSNNGGSNNGGSSNNGSGSSSGNGRSNGSGSNNGGSSSNNAENSTSSVNKTSDNTTSATSNKKQIAQTGNANTIIFSLSIVGLIIYGFIALRKFGKLKGIK